MFANSESPYIGFLNVGQWKQWRVGSCLLFCCFAGLLSPAPPWVSMAALGIKTPSMTISKQCWVWVAESKAMLTPWYSKLRPDGILELREISKNWRRFFVEVSCRSKYDQKKHSSALSGRGSVSIPLCYIRCLGDNAWRMFSDVCACRSLQVRKAHLICRHRFGRNQLKSSPAAKLKKYPLSYHFQFKWLE